MTRRQRLEQAFRAYGVTDAARLESYVRGCDLKRPASSRTLQPGDMVQVWVRNGGTPGRYGSPPGEDPARLGIMIEALHQEIFVVRTALRVISCIAAAFPTGLVDDIGGEGGGRQYILPPDWLESVERIS
jgi:hypothetical protein